MKRRKVKTASALPPAILPRLVDRRGLAAYLNVSPQTVDAWRLRDLLPPPVPLPAAHRDGLLRTPMWDIRDLDRLIDTWKSGVKESPMG